MNLDGAAIVLGAGASYGAKLRSRTNPPLDSNFLYVAGKMFNGKHVRGPHAERIKAWKEFKTQLSRVGLKYEDIKTWRLEQLSTFLEARSNLKGLQLQRGRPQEFRKALDSLKVMVCHAILARNGASPCDFHSMLFDAVRPSGVITFNYDLIADRTLMAQGRLNWKHATYRGSRIAKMISADGKRYFRHLGTARPRGAVPLLKLHGSINWEKLDRGEGYRISGIKLAGRASDEFEFVSIPDEPYLIPPVAAKIEIQQKMLKGHWYKAKDILHNSKTWIIWGYSFPQTDTIAQVLFRTALMNNRKPKKVIVVNPDFGAASRVEEVCKKVVVEQFVSIESLLTQLGALTRSEKR